MPVHFTVATHSANSVADSRVSNADEVLSATWGQSARTLKSAELLQSSFHTGKHDFTRVYDQSNGFVDTVLLAYNAHHHLVMRPDDVWIAILSQFNFYVNAHAEELRSHFVAHEGKKHLVVKAVGTRYTVNFGDLARQMTGKIHENVVDNDLKDWILPDFTTTTHNDTVVSAVMMMATLKAYFSYGFELSCGIPSVTLEGEKVDWEKLLARIEKLKDFGSEPTMWASLLRPILTRFVNAFDGEPDLDFWAKVCHHRPQFSGATMLFGWVTAFCVWDSEGKWQGPVEGRAWGLSELKLDGIQYGIIKADDVPAAYCEVDVELDDNGEIFECMMVSGHVATLVEGELKDTVRPLPAWFMFIKEECEDPDVAEMRELREQYPDMFDDLE